MNKCHSVPAHYVEGFSRCLPHGVDGEPIRVELLVWSRSAAVVMVDDPSIRVERLKMAAWRRLTNVKEQGLAPTNPLAVRLYNLRSCRRSLIDPSQISICVGWSTSVATVSGHWVRSPETCARASTSANSASLDAIRELCGRTLAWYVSASRLALGLVRQLAAVASSC